MASSLLRVAALSSRMPCLLSRTLGAYQSGERIGVGTTEETHQQRLLSSAPQRQPNLLKLPPNLKIDPRSTSSPFYGLEPVSNKVFDEDEKTVQDKEDDKLEELQEDGLEADSQQVEEADDDDSEEDMAMVEDLLFDVSQRPEPYRAIPLPDRLFVSVHAHDKEVVGTLPLSSKLFGHNEIRVDLLQRAVEHHRACVRGRRKAITKTIGQVSGSGRKVRQQKGGGVARAGHSRPAHWRGGAKAHGPKGWIQNYAARKLNRKVRQLALTHALSQKLKEGNLIVLNDLQLESYKTKELAKLLKSFDIAGRHGTKALLLDHVEAQEDETTPTSHNGLPINLMVAAGNLRSIQVLNQLFANVYAILKHEKLVMTVSAIEALEARLEHKLR